MSHCLHTDHEHVVTITCITSAHVKPPIMIIDEVHFYLQCVNLGMCVQ